MILHATRPWRSIGILACLAISSLLFPARATAEEGVDRRLYVAVPGIRNYLEYGGHGILVYDIDHDHKFLKRIPTAGLNREGKPDNVKGICASAQTRRLYVSTTISLACYDLESEKLLWEREYEGGCDRMAIAPNGRDLYVPSFEKAHWHVIDGRTGDVLAKIVPNSGSHNTIYGLDGAHAYLAGLKSPLLTVANTSTRTVERLVGPFSNVIRPFTVNGTETRCYVNVNELLGFEIGDLTTGKKLGQIRVQGFTKGPVKRHGCPSHGIGLTPDEKEIWVVDAYNQQIHIFDATVMPPKQVQSLKVRDEPGWVTFSLDGRFAYPSTGEVFDTKTRKIVATLSDEHAAAVMSEKMVEIDFRGKEPVRTGDQFGLGRVTSPRNE